MDRSPSAIPEDLTVAAEPYDSDGPRWVVAQAEAELVVRYGLVHESELGLTAAMFDPPLGAFLVARAGAAGPPVGGVGLRALRPGLGQVRRLWVDPTRRQQGVARSLMVALEETARDLGMTALRLSTGERQPEAVALYEATGWVPFHSHEPSYGFRFSKEVAPRP
jgi:GNAT superfamily N-acetyltransferase